MYSSASVWIRRGSRSSNVASRHAAESPNQASTCSNIVALSTGSDTRSDSGPRRTSSSMKPLGVSAMSWFLMPVLPSAAILPSHASAASRVGFVARNAAIASGVARPVAAVVTSVSRRRS